MEPIDRRHLLRAGAAATVAAGLGLGARAASPAQDELRTRREQRGIKKAVKLGMVAGDAPVKDKLALLKELGFDGVELDSPSELDRAEVLAARDEVGLPIHGVVDSVHWQHTLSDPDPELRARGVAALEHALRDCAAFGGTTVLLVPAVVNARVAYDEAYERSQAEIRRALPLAEELGVTIALENVWNSFLLSPLEAARYVDELESDAIGWYLDVGNIVNYGWPEQWVRILGRRIKKLDVKGFSRKKRNDEGLWKGFQVEIGEGDCGWPAVMAALDEIGYAGWATAEVAGGGPERLKDVAERMDRVLSA